MNSRYDIVIVGGGLAGLISALALARAGYAVALVEKKTYPFHKVCGEYVSNETRPFLTSLGLDVDALGAARIQRLEVSAPGGELLTAALPMGGFGISRYTLDEALYQLGKSAGVTFLLNTRVQEVRFTDNSFVVALDDERMLEAGLVIGAYGKREKLDRQLNRAFLNERTGYMGVKYHIRADFPQDLIALHNFAGGYCGISAIETGRYCLCYLTRRETLKPYAGIPEMEAAVLAQNPYLKRIFAEAEFLYARPEVINEISFARKEAVEQHIWMCGDAAGLITPLCGNGMAMAIRGAHLLSELLIATKAFQNHRLPDAASRAALEQRYARIWAATFASRLWAGRQLQRLFGAPRTTRLAVNNLRHTPRLTQWLIRQTHGEVF